MKKNKICAIIGIFFIGLFFVCVFADKYEPTPTDTPTPTPTPTPSPTPCDDKYGEPPCNTPTPTPTPPPPTPTPNCPLTWIKEIFPSCGVEAGHGYYNIESCLNGIQAAEYCNFLLPRPQYFYEDCISDGSLAEYGAFVRSYLPISLAPVAVHYPNGVRTEVQFPPLSFSQPPFYERGTASFVPNSAIGNPYEWIHMRRVVEDGNPSDPAKIKSLFGSQNGWVHKNFNDMPPEGWRLVNQSVVSPIYCDDWGGSYYSNWDDIVYINSVGSFEIDFPLSDPVAKYNENAEDKANELNYNYCYAPVAGDVTVIAKTITFKNVDAFWIHPDLPFHDPPFDPPVEIGAQLMPKDVIWKTSGVPYKAKLTISDPNHPGRQQVFIAYNTDNYPTPVSSDKPLNISGDGKVTGSWDGCFYEYNNCYPLEGQDYHLCLEIHLDNRIMMLDPAWTSPGHVQEYMKFEEHAFEEIRCRCGCSSGPMMQGNSYSINNEGMIGNQIKLATGEKHENSTDLEIKGRGIDISWERAYRSGKNRTTAMGRNWDFSYNRYLEYEDSDFLVNFGDNYTVRFIPHYSQANVWWARGQFEKLSQESDGTYLLKFPGGETWKFYSFSSPTAPGKIKEISDSNGNTIFFFYEPGVIPGIGSGWRLDYITDSMHGGDNHIIDVSYNDSGYITDIRDRDIANRTVNYEYYGSGDPDGNPGDLKSATSPIVTGTVTGNNFPNGQKIVYTYHKGMVGQELRPELQHKLLTITDARRNDPNDPSFGEGPNQSYVYGENSHDLNSYAKVIEQIQGDKSIQIFYQKITPVESHNFANMKVITNDQMGNVCESFITKYQTLVNMKTFSGRAIPGIPTTEIQNRPQNPLHPADPEYFESRYEYNGDFRLKRATFPDTSKLLNVYESEIPNSAPTIMNRGNVREVWNMDPQDNSILQNAYEYDGEGCGSCGLGSPTKITDTLGSELKMSYDNNGNRVYKLNIPVALSYRLNQAQATGEAGQLSAEWWEYNLYGQVTKYTDAENNVTEYIYYPETDYNGDGLEDNLLGDDETGGFLKEVIRDTTDDPSRNSGTNPFPVSARTRYIYDVLGNVTREIDCRGIATDNDYNALGQLIRTRRATANGLYGVTEPLPLTNYAYEERKFYDANGNIVLEHIEDRGNTTLVDGNLSSADLEAVGLDTVNPDPVGGTAYVDTLYKYNDLNNIIEEVWEVQNGATLKVTRKKYRYDLDENRVLTIYPDGRADAQFYDERAMNYKSVQGILSPPPEAIMLSGDPSTFSSPGKTNATPRVTKNEYDSNLRLKKVIDASDAGNPITVNEIAYDIRGRKSVETDAMGNKIQYTYDDLNRVIRVIKEGEYPQDLPGSTNNKILAVTENVYDSASRTIATHSLVFDPSGTTPAPTLTVNSDMALLAPYLTDAPSNTAHIPEAPQLTVLGRITTINEYDKLDRVTFSISPDLGVTRLYYDGMGRTIKTMDSAINNGYDPVDDKFNPANLSGNMSQTEYDKNGNVVEQLIPDSFHTTFYYDSLNRIMTQFDNIGQTSDFRYDSQGRIVAQSDPKGPGVSRILARRGLGNTDSVTLNNYGNISRMYYDGLGRTIRQESFLTSSGDGNGTYIGADEFGVKIAPQTGYLDPTQSGDGIVTNDSSYDEAGFLLARRDDNGNTTAYIYDTLGRKIKERKGLNFTGSSLSIVGGQTVEFFGVLPGGEPVVITEPNGTDVTLSYTNRGFLLTRTDEVGNVFNYVNDALGRQASVTIVLGPAVIGTTMQTFQYDGFGRITSMSDNNVHIPDPNGYYNVICSYAFDSLSRQLYEKQTLGKQGFNSTKTLSYSYDASCGSSFSPSSFIYPDGTQINNTYDRLGRLIARRRQGDDFDIGRYDWIGAGRRTVLTYPNGTRLTFIAQNGGEDVYVGYDALGRSLNHRWEKTDGLLGHGTLLMGFETRTATGAPLYDRAGNKMITYRTHQPSRSELYHYDSIGRLSGRGASLPTGAAFQRGTFKNGVRTSMDPSQGGVIDYYQEWDLDGLGNWTAFNDNSLTPESRTHSEYNEIVTVPGITQNHDKNGNLRSDGTLLYFWDAFNRLKYIERISDNMGMGEFLYDAQNRRIFHTAPFQDAPTYGNARRYLYSGPQLIAEYFKPSGAAEHLLEQYAYGVYLDEVWARQKMIPNVIGGYDSEYLLFHHDPLYSVSGVSDPWGNLLEAYEYDPYGRRIVITDGPDPDSIVNFTSDDIRGTVSPRHVKQAFTGQIYDEETGLYYYKERYYHPGWGRFISRDPVISSKNLYQYCKSEPINMTDPRGLKELKEFWDYYLKGFGKDRNSNENPPEVKSMFYYIFFRIDQSIKEVSTWDRNRFYHVGNYRDGRREDSTGGVVYNSEKNRWEGECEGLAQKLSDEQYDKYRHSLRDPDNPFDASKKPEMLGFGKIHKWAGVTENHIVYRDHWSAIIIPPYKVNLKAECTTSGRWKKVENSERIKERYTDQINAVYLSYMNPGKYMIMDPQYGYNVDTITQWLLPSWTNWGIRDVIKE